MKKTLMIMLALVLVIAMSVTGTLAYLTSTSETVTNTFTVGKLAIALDEAKVDVYGVEVDGADRVTGNEYKLIPGHNYAKDPTVWVEKDSEASYIYVKVENGIAAIEADTTIAAQIADNDWTALGGVANVYYKEADAVPADAAERGKYVVFESFTLDDEADVSDYENANITIVAYAVQKDGFDSAAEAWNANFTPATAVVPAA